MVKHPVRVHSHKSRGIFKSLGIDRRFGISPPSAILRIEPLKRIVVSSDFVLAEKFAHGPGAAGSYKSFTLVCGWREIKHRKGNLVYGLASPVGEPQLGHDIVLLQAEANLQVNRKFAFGSRELRGRQREGVRRCLTRAEATPLAT